MLKFPGKICEYGGIFIAPYFVCLIFIGFPMLHLHLCIGQYAGETPDAAFYRLMPITCGVGWAFVLAAIPVIIYHNFVVIWSLQYLWYSMLSMVISDRMPWENRELTAADASIDFGPLRNVTLTASEFFFHFDILSLTSYTQLAPSLPQRHIVLALTSAWLLIFICICKGTTWMTWAFRLTATIPYLMLFILLIRGLSLPGASIGLSFLFSSVSNSVLSLKIWSAAAEQVLFEVGVGTGAIMSIAAYSKYRNYVYRDAALLAIINAFTSVLASMVLFSFLGLLSISSGKDISSIINHDPFYMIFTVIPSTTSLMRWGPLWMSILFATVVLTAMDAEFIWIEMLASSVMNVLGSKDRRLNSRVITIICCLGLLLQIPICNSDGFFVFHSMNSLISSVPTFILSFLVLTAFTYLYGVDRFLKDVSSMLRIPMGNATKWVHLRVQEKLLELFGPCGSFIRISWVLICPCFLTVLMLTHAASYKRPLLFDRHVPLASEFFAWTLVYTPLTAALVGAIIAIVKMRQSGKRISSLFDSSSWHQEEVVVHHVDLPPSTPSYNISPKRENTYMYIDPTSRGPTIRSACQPCVDNYGWRNGRLKEWQETVSLDHLPSQPSFATSLASQTTLTLFGSPPASNGFMVSDTTSECKVTTISNENKEERSPMKVHSLHAPSPELHNIRLETISGTFTHSERPSKTYSGSDLVPSTSSPPPRISPSRSEPPTLTTDHPTSSVRSKIGSPDEFSESDDETGVRQQRSTIIRRFRSEDSVQAFSTGSISITPIGIARQRSLSSVAIYDNIAKTSGLTQTLSRLKRPAPIETPTRF